MTHERIGKMEDPWSQLAGTEDAARKEEERKGDHHLLSRELYAVRGTFMSALELPRNR